MFALCGYKYGIYGYENGTICDHKHDTTAIKLVQDFSELVQVRYEFTMITN